MRDFEPKEFEPLGIVLRIPVKRRRKPVDLAEGESQQRRKRPGDGGGRAQVARIVSRAPEVMVKVSGGARGFKNLREHLNYITRNGTLVAETPDGEIYGRGDVSDTAIAWWSNRGQAQAIRRANSRESVNLVLSMPPGTDRDKFLEAARSFASRTFAGNHDYLLVEHRDTEHPHVHVTVRAVGHDMTRLNPKKADLQMWREGLALELRDRGIIAEATPRRSRGVVQKGKSQAITHLDLRGASKVQRAKIAEAVREMAGKVKAGERPWEAATWKRQGMIREAWTQLAEQFEGEGGTEARLLGQSIRQFVAEMPPLRTERDSIRQLIDERAQRGGGGQIDKAGQRDDDQQDR